MSSWLDDYLNRHHDEEWDLNIKYNNKERAKMIINTLENDPDLMKEFNLLLRKQKLNNIKINGRKKI